MRIRLQHDLGTFDTIFKMLKRRSSNRKLFTRIFFSVKFFLGYIIAVFFLTDSICRNKFGNYSARFYKCIFSSDRNERIGTFTITSTQKTLKCIAASAYIARTVFSFHVPLFFFSPVNHIPDVNAHNRRQNLTFASLKYF